MPHRVALAVNHWVPRARVALTLTCFTVNSSRPAAKPLYLAKSCNWLLLARTTCCIWLRIDQGQVFGKCIC